MTAPKDLPATLGTCPLCREKELGYLFESSGFHFYQCPACGYARRREPASATVHVYHDASYLDQFSDEKEHRNKKGAFLRECARHTPPTGRLLDLGCSIGILLDEARKMGWDPYGVEISAGAAERAKARGLSNVWTMPLEEARFEENFFQVVVMSHVLEHLDDPFGMLRTASRWVAPGGLLCLGVPNFSSRSARRDGPAWSTLFPSDHISQFTVSAIRRAVEQYAGFGVVAVSGDHRFGEEQKGLGGRINYFIDYLKDLSLTGRSLVLIARKPILALSRKV